MTGIEELAPADVPDDALSDAEFVALAKAFEARGGEAADTTHLDGVWLDSDQRTPQQAQRAPEGDQEGHQDARAADKVDDTPAMKAARKQTGVRQEGQGRRRQADALRGAVRSIR